MSEAWTPWYKNLAREGDLVGRCSSAPLHDCMKSSASPRFICHTRRRASWLVCCLFDGVDRCITAFLLDEDEFPIRPSAHCAAQDARLIWTCGFEKRMIDTFQHHGADRTQHRFPASTFIDEMRKKRATYRFGARRRQPISELQDRRGHECQKNLGNMASQQLSTESLRSLQSSNIHVS